ncbi:MAG: putative peptidoglycan lipid flippase [Pseudonocardiales bacterium]|nr:putative peptidoglycan lipid flippase [Pseudonocardiales bacterium]
MHRQPRDAVPYEPWFDEHAVADDRRDPLLVRDGQRRTAVRAAPAAKIPEYLVNGAERGGTTEPDTGATERGSGATERGSGAPEPGTGTAERGTGSTVRNSVTVAAWTLLSRVAGLLRVLVIGALLGSTYFSNVFQAGYVLPSNVFTVMAGPVLGMVVVPAVVRAAALGGLDRASEVLGRVAGRLLAVAGLCAVGLALLSPALAWTLVFDVPEPERGKAWLLSIVLILFVTPQVLLYTVAELGVAAQQGRQRFALAAAAPAVESMGTIATLLVTVWIYGGGLDVGQAPLSMMVLLGLGTTGSVLLHAALQCYGAYRAGVALRPRRGWRDDPDARDSLRRIARSIPVAACPAVANYGLTVVAATIPGGVLIVQLSYQVFYALSFVGARAVSMAALPGLAEAMTARDHRRFGTAWRQGVFYVMVVGIPLLCLLAVFARPTADILANGGLRDGELISELAACLAVVAFAQLIGGLHDFGQQALFARLDDRGPRLASFTALGATVLVSAGSLLLPVAGGRLTGLAVAILAGELAGGLTALVRLRRAMCPEPMFDRKHALTVTAATAAMLPVIALGWWVVTTLAPARPLELALLVACGLLALVPYALVLLLLSSGDRWRRRPASASIVPTDLETGLPAGRWASRHHRRGCAESTAAGAAVPESAASGSGLSG